MSRSGTTGNEDILQTLENVVRTGELPPPPVSAASDPVALSTPTPAAGGTSATPPPSPGDLAATAPVGSSTAPILAQITFSGLVRVLESQVRELLRAKEWQPYPQSAEDADLKALLGSGLFTSASLRRVELSSTTIRLDVRVAEAPPRAAPAPGPAAKAAPPEVKAAAKALGAAEPELPAPPWVIGELEIRGNRNVKESVIRRQILGRKGDLYSRSDHDRDLQNVLNLGGFERAYTDIQVLKDRAVPETFAEVSPSKHPVRVAFIVEEKPLLVKIEFVGRQKISKGTLSEDLTLKERDPFDRVKLRQDQDAILAVYRKKGYHQASVDAKVDIDTATLKATVAFLIDEGPRARIADVRIAGVRAFKPKKIVKQLDTNRRKKVFDEAKLKEDLAKLESFYKNRGYLDFKVLHTSVSYSADQTRIFLDLAVEEGRVYRFGDSSFAGHSVYASTELAKAVRYKKGRLFSQERFDETLQEIRELYAEKGRLRTVVDPKKTFDEKTGLLDVRYEIAEGGIVYVDHIDIAGEKATKEYVFRREVVLRPGMPFAVSKLRRSAERIRNLGFIDDVQFDLQSPYDPDLVDLTFEVFEGKPGMLTAGAGFSSLDGLIGTLSLQHLNMLGRAYRTSVSWSFGSRVNDFSVSWMTPWVKDKPVSLGMDLFNTRRISPFEGSSRAFTNKRVGGTLRVGPRFMEDKYQLRFNYTFAKISVADVQSQFLGTLSEGTSISSVLGVEAARDTRDNIWDPGTGSRHSLGFNFSGGALQGDIHFFKPFIHNSRHWTLAHIEDYPLVFSLSNRASYVTPFGDTKEVPVFERFFIGGQDSLRGYSAIGEVGAREGGKVYDVLNAELGFPLARERRSTIVKFVTFFDAGGTWENTRSMHLRVGTGARDIKTDVGFGIRFTTPAFPIRLDWGYGFQHRPGEDRTQINFGIGSLF